MIIELKLFEDMSPAEQRQHLLEVLVDGDVTAEQLEELRRSFRQRVRQAKNAERAYLTCAELGEMVGRSADTIRKMFRHDRGVKTETHSGRNRKSYMTMLISRAAANRRFPDLNL